MRLASEYQAAADPGCGDRICAASARAAAGAHFADLNGDSIPDVVIGNESGGLEYFEGRKKNISD